MVELRFLRYIIIFEIFIHSLLFNFTFAIIILILFIIIRFILSMISFWFKLYDAIVSWMMLDLLRWFFIHFSYSSLSFVLNLLIQFFVYQWIIENSWSYIKKAFLVNRRSFLNERYLSASLYRRSNRRADASERRLYTIFIIPSKLTLPSKLNNHWINNFIKTK